MKLGGGSIRPMFKVLAKSTSLRCRPYVAAAAAIMLILMAVLSGCGQISLKVLLENEEPGDLSITPSNASIPAGGILDISGRGGFKPYTYEDVSLNPIGSLDSQTGVYTAPDENNITGDSEQVEIEVSDYFGTKASALFMVYKPVRLGPTVQTVQQNDSVLFTVSGGVAPYDYYVDGALVSENDDANWSYTFTSEGGYTVEVADSLGNDAASAITVVAAGELSIDAPRGWIQTGDPDPLVLTAVNPVSPHTFSIQTPGAPAEVGRLELDDPPELDLTAEYYAPDVETVVSVELSDDAARSVTMQIHVVGEPPPILILTPFIAWVETDDADISLTAFGGVPPYHFTLVGAGSLVEHPVHDNKRKYLPPDFATTAYVWVEDAVGQKKKATIYVLEDD